MQYQNLPDALKQQKHFCLWKREMRKGNYTKVPYQTNGARARPNDLSTFTDFTSVLSIYNGGGYDGIGLLNDDLVGLDCDDCVNDDGTLSDLAIEVINTVDSYAEYSPSGKGIRIWARAADLSYDKAKYYINNRKFKLEIYVPGQTNRFLTLTGNAIGNKDVEERSGEIQTVLEAYMLRPVAPKPKTSVPHMSYLSDEEIIQKASKAVNADKFIPLWNGDALADAGADHSALDLRLCSILAFYSGGNAEQMDRLFRESRLMRDKWDSRRGNGTYGDMTIQKAIDGCSQFYEPVYIPSASEDFNDQYQMLLEVTPEKNLRYRGNDQGNGRLLADLIRHKARYSPERKLWMVYDGKRWIPDVGAMKVMELAKDIGDALLIYASGIKDEEVQKAFVTNARRWLMRRSREIYIREAQSVYPVMMADFDKDRYLFNCENGTLDLRTLEFRDHSPEDRITKISPVTYDADAKCD